MANDKIEYFTKNNHPKTEPQDYHHEYVTNYVELFDKNGEPYLEPTETYNQWERTQSYADDCKIENVIAAAQRGDFSMLMQRKPTYMDATGLPKTLAEAQNLVIRMKDEFMKMPNEVKEKFNNSPEMYVNMMGTPEFDKIMGSYNKHIADIAKAKSIVEPILEPEKGEA